MSDAPKDLEGFDLTLDSCVNLRNALVDLLKHPGYAWLEAFAKAQIEGREKMFDGPIKPEQTLEQEYVKGERKGMLTLMVAPANQIDTLNDYIDRFRRMEDAEEEESGSAAA